MDVSTAAGWTTVAAEPINWASSVGAGDGVVVSVGSDVMVIAPVDSGGEAPAWTPLAIASTANERTAGLPIIALPPASDCLEMVGDAATGATWSRQDQRSDANAALSSWANKSGCSHIAK